MTFIETLLCYFNIVRTIQCVVLLIINNNDNDNILSIFGHGLPKKNCPIFDNLKSVRGVQVILEPLILVNRSAGA